MFVPNRARRSVVFVGDLTERGTFRPRGTAFFVGIPSSKQGLAFPYLVTAQHVVVMLQERQKPIYCRFNRKGGEAKVEPLQVPRWWYHPDSESEQTDVAVAAMHVNWDIIDHEPIPMPEKWEISSIAAFAGRQEIGLGDETFAIGLFRRHAGTQRNIPIIRIGNIAALPEEPIPTRWGLMEALLVEMRSIAGLSGSPVFVNLPSAVAPFVAAGGMVPDIRYQSDYEEVHWFQFHFLGLIHGHFDIPDLIEDSVVDDGDAEQRTGINTGIGIVIPAKKITETLYQPELVAERQAIEAAFDRDQAATPDDDT